MHTEYCGGTCGGETKCKECWLNEAFPCDASCENMLPDGSPDVTKCKAIGCDAILWDEYIEPIVANSVEEAEEMIMKEYAESEVCLGELLASIIVHGLSVEEVVTLYARLMKRVEEDIMIVIKEGEPIIIE